MGNSDGDADGERVTEQMTDLDDESADLKTYECDDCGTRVEAAHQPGECPNCGGEMFDISISRE